MRRHLTTLGSLVLLLLAWSYRIDMFELLLWGGGADGLFTRVDHVYTTRIDLLMAIGTLAAALIVLRAGWIGQVRAAFVTVTVVLVAAVLLRQAGPSLVANGALAGVSDAQDRDYEATRALFTRRAYDVASVVVEEPPAPLVNAGTRGDGDTAGEDDTARARRELADAVGSVALWDAEVLSRSRGAGDQAFELVIPPVWQAGDDGPLAVLVTRTAAVSPVWDVRVVPGAFGDERGAPVVARHRGLGAGILPEPLVAPGMTEHRVVRGPALEALRAADAGARSLHRRDPFRVRPVPAADLTSMPERLAHAWHTRDVSLLSTPAVDEAVAVVLHRELRGRVERLLPALAQGDAIAPIVHEGGLLWAIDLYSASESYPLSVRFQLAGAARSYFRRAGTALVDAQTGRVYVVPVASPDPLAATWFTYVPELLLEAGDLPAALRRQLPIPTDGALAQLRAFSRVGSARTGHTPRFVPDSLPGAAPFPVAMPVGRDDVISWSVPLVDAGDQLVGVFEASGGAEREARWHAMREPLPRWSALQSRVGVALDSASAEARSATDGPAAAGVPRLRAAGGRPFVVRPAYTDDGAGLRLLTLAASSDERLWTGASLEAVLGASRAGPVPDGPRRTLSEAERARETRRLYESMRAALRQSEWLRFGAAFDSLGQLLDRSP